MFELSSYVAKLHKFISPVEKVERPSLRRYEAELELIRSTSSFRAPSAGGLLYEHNARRAPPFPLFTAG